VEVVFLQMLQPGYTLPFVNLLDLSNPFGFAIGSKPGSRL
jgi:hypothetical protein